MVRSCVFLQAEEAAHARDEIGDVFVGEGIVERQHRHFVNDFGEFRRRLRADAMRRAVGPHQQRKARFDLGVAAAQRVVVGIGNLRRVFLIIAPVVLGDFVGEPVELLFRFGGGEFIDGFLSCALCAIFCGRGCASASRRRAAARASSVMAAPDSMRAISSMRASSSSNSTRVRSPLREMRKWRAARAATCGEWVTSSTCVVRASRCSRSPTASATAPPTPRSTSSNTSAAGGLISASATFSASEKRASSPPEAIFVSGPKGAPSTVAISKATRSRPLARLRHRSTLERDAELGVAEFQRREFGGHRRFELAAPRRCAPAESLRAISR